MYVRVLKSYFKMTDCVVACSASLCECMSHKVCCLSFYFLLIFCIVVYCFSLIN